MRKKIKPFLRMKKKIMKEMKNKCKENKKGNTEKAAEKWNEFTKTAKFERKKNIWIRTISFCTYNTYINIWCIVIENYHSASHNVWVYVNVNGIDVSDQFGNAARYQSSNFYECAEELVWAFQVVFELVSRLITEYYGWNKKRHDILLP